MHGYVYILHCMHVLCVSSLYKRVCPVYECTYPSSLSSSAAGLFLPLPVLLLLAPPLTPSSCWPRDADSGDPSSAIHENLIIKVHTI